MIIMSKTRFMARHYWKENEFIQAEVEMSAMPKSPWRRVPLGSPAVEREVQREACSCHAPLVSFRCFCQGFLYLMYVYLILIS